MIPGEDETVSEIDDAALFALAAGDAQAEVTQEAPVKTEAAAEKEEKVVLTAEQIPSSSHDQKPPEQDHRVPLRELLDERDRRQQYERQLAEMQRQMQELQKAQQKPVDLITDPDGYQEAIKREIEERFARQEKVNLERDHRRIFASSADAAIAKYGDEFTEAFEAFDAVAGVTKGNDEILRSRVVGTYKEPASNPAEGIIQWYRQAKTLRETGGDLNAYREKLLQQERERLAKDPEFRKQVIEGLRTEAASRPPVTQMPSLNRTPAAASNAGDDDRDLGDAELFSYATTRRRR